MLDQIFSPWDVVDGDSGERSERRPAGDAGEARPRGLRGWATRLIEALGGGRDADDPEDPRNDERYGRGKLSRGQYHDDPGLF